MGFESSDVAVDSVKFPRQQRLLTHALLRWKSDVLRTDAVAFMRLSAKKKKLFSALLSVIHYSRWNGL